MIALYITGGMLLLFILLLLLRIKVFFSYYGKVPCIELRALGISYSRELKGGEEDGEDALEEALKKQKKEKGKKSKKDKKAQQGKPSVKQSLSVLYGGVRDFLKRFKKYARLEKYVMKISLATEDAALTAVLYGALSGVVASLHTAALSVKNRSRRVGDIFTEYRPDFYAEKTDIGAEIGFSLRVWQILSVGLGLWRTYRKYKKLPPKAAKNKGDTQDEQRTA